jgi:hypothetical protein
VDETHSKPYAPSCDRNKDAILVVLNRYLSGTSEILEIGSGTGQHAVYMGEHLPNLRWQTSELPEHHAGIRAWIRDSGLTNVIEPLELDVNEAVWPIQSIQAIYTANTAHIMSWGSVEAMFRGVGRTLNGDGLLLIYGPFNYNGELISSGNRQLNDSIKSNDNASAIRNFEAVDELACANGLKLVVDNEMPANNRLLVWSKQASSS